MGDSSITIAPTDVQKKRALPWALGGQAANAVVVNLCIAGPIFMMFLTGLGLSKAQIGVALSILPFLVTLSAVFAPLAAKFGYKRTFLVGWTLRKCALVFLAAVPWVASQYGIEMAFWLVAIVLIVFGLLRTVSLAALNPWMQEFIPDAVRGKFGGVASITGIMVGAATLALGGHFLGTDPPLSRYTMLFIIAFGFGLASSVFYSFVPGGNPAGSSTERTDVRAMLSSLKDRTFIRFLIGGGLVTLGWVAASPGGFLALFLRERAGFSVRDVTMVSSVTMITGVLTSFFWGWAADRYGSKPVMMVCLLPMAFFPLGLVVLCVVPDLIYPGMLVAGGLVGLFLPGWGIGYSRYLFVNVIPADRRSGYFGMQMTLSGLIGGFAPILAGSSLELAAGLNMSLGRIHVGPYFPLLIAAFLLMILAVVVLDGLPTDSGVSTARFVGMFLSGNPLVAMQAMYAHSRGGPEQRRVLSVERLGRAKSPLARAELLDSLRDVSLTVRLTAIASIATTRPDSELTDALLEILRSGFPDTVPAAISALGRIGDQRAIPLIREQLDSEFSLVRGRAAVALGQLGDVDSASRLLDRFLEDRVACGGYAEALGSLRCAEAVVPLIERMSGVEDELRLSCLAFSVARIVGGESDLLLLLRTLHKNVGSAREEAHYLLRSQLPAVTSEPDRALELADEILSVAIAEDLEALSKSLRKVVAIVAADRLSPVAWTVINNALPGVAGTGMAARFNAILVVHALVAGGSPTGKTKSD